MRVYRTADGELCLDGDERAAFLVYGEADPIPPKDQEIVDRLLGKGEEKAVRAPRNKQAAKPEDK